MLRRSPAIESACIVIGDFGAAVRDLAKKRRPTPVPRASETRPITGSMAPNRAPISTRGAPPLELLSDAEIDAATEAGRMSPTEASQIRRSRRAELLGDADERIDARRCAG